MINSLGIYQWFTHKWRLQWRQIPGSQILFTYYMCFNQSDGTSQFHTKYFYTRERNSPTVLVSMWDSDIVWPLYKPEPERYPDTDMFQNQTNCPLPPHKLTRPRLRIIMSPIIITSRFMDRIYICRFSASFFVHILIMQNSSIRSGRVTHSHWGCKWNTVILT